MRVVLASNNLGKIREFIALLAPVAIEVIPQSQLGVPEIEETGLSFIENSILKARHASKVTGLPAIADDSGLVVPALNGNPGIYSARYAGVTAKSADNIQKLLTAMQSIPDEQRQAYFNCVLVFMQHELDPTPIVCTGQWYGKILRASQGTEGFGYDPVFYDPNQNKTAAELPLELKNKISHRGIALQLLLSELTKHFHR